MYETETVVILFLLGLGCMCFLAFLENKIVKVLFFVVGVFIFLVAGTGIRESSLGLPKEDLKDGVYEVLVVGFDTKKNIVSVAVLKEEGKTLEGLPKYHSLPIEFFWGAEINKMTVGKKRTVKIKKAPLQRATVAE